MLKKSIKYIDFNGNEQIDECYFNLSKNELTQMEMSERGGFQNYITKIVEEKDNKKIYELFKEIVLSSYGEKSADGRSFIKKKIIDGHPVRLRDEFEQTAAFDELMMELINSSEQGVAEFINKVIPKELAEELTKQDSNKVIPKEPAKRDSNK